MRPASRTLAQLVENGHGIGGINDVSRWPWTWHRLINYCRHIQNIYERAAYDEDKQSAVPPKWMWWDADALDNWFEERRQFARSRKKEPE